jgi:hypothetical protein
MSCTAHGAGAQAGTYFARVPSSDGVPLDATLPFGRGERMLMLLVLQTAEQTARAQGVAGARFFWFLVTVLVIALIVLVIKKIMKS